MIGDSEIRQTIKFKNNLLKENAERDELGFAVSWKRALSQLYNFTSWLHSYCIINSIAIQKITKKYKKQFEKFGFMNCEELLGCHPKDLEFIKNINDVVELRREMKKFYAQQFTYNSIEKAQNELQSRMKGQRTKDIALISLYIGILVTLIFSFGLVSFIDST